MACDGGTTSSFSIREPAISLRGPVSESKARRRRSMRLSSERGDETETREEAYGDPIPQNVNFLDEKSKSSAIKTMKPPSKNR